jgi:hypothetical protein
MELVELEDDGRWRGYSCCLNFRRRYLSSLYIMFLAHVLYGPPPIVVYPSASKRSGLRCQLRLGFHFINKFNFRFQQRMALVRCPAFLHPCIVCSHPIREDGGSRGERSNLE